MISNQLHIAWRHLSPDERVVELVDRESRRLAGQHPEASDCHVLLERHRGQRKDKPFQVRVQVTVPGQRVVTSRDPDDGSSTSAELQEAVADAFELVRRSLGCHRGGGSVPFRQPRPRKRPGSLRAPRPRWGRHPGGGPSLAD